MKKIIALALSAFSTLGYAQDQSHAQNLYYPEATSAVKTDLNTWKKLGNTAQAVFVSSDMHFDKQVFPASQGSRTAVMNAWKGERVHQQILYFSGMDAPALAFHIGALKSDDGHQISADAITVNFIRYVKTDVFAGGCGFKNTAHIDSALVADVLDINPKIPYTAHTVQPLWLSVQVPQHTPKGIYKGVISIQGTQNIKLTYQIKVADHTLAKPSEWTYDLDFWQHPAAIARIHGVPLWSDAHFDWMKKYYTQLAQAGQKVITASIIDEAWNHQTYDDFPSLIKWTKEKNGSWSYDYTLFDKYIQFVMDCGIRQRINCYSMIPWKIQFQYFDATQGKNVYQTDAPGSEGYNVFWGNMLQNFAQHLKQKGWFGITAIAMDERSMPDMKAVIQLVKSVDKDFKVSLAGAYHPEIEADIDDYCIASKEKFPAEILQKRLSAHKPSTVYTCCTEEYPNGFTFSPPAENTWLSWYASAKGFTGYVRWAYNSWVANPLVDSRFRTWPGGDTYQIYPGPRSSVRFEKMVEGIQDFEKISTLRASFIQNKEAEKLKALDQMLAAFEISKLSKTSAQNMLQTARKQLLDLQ